jgi:pyruvate dehydrogenase E1 component beta subunit
MWFGEAIKLALIQNLKSNKKFMVFGQGVNSKNYGLKDIAPKQVLEMPISEVGFTGMAVGLASQGFRPFVHHISTEFALLVLDQILTHASRWSYNFGTEYKCPISLRISVGRGWGNGPQHTATYHSIFLQSPGLDVMIPSLSQEAYDQVLYLLHNNNPSVFLEHRWLYKISSKLKIKKKITKLNRATLIKGTKKILLLTYGDGLVECIKTKEILNKNGLDCSILSISYLPAHQRVNANLINCILDYDKIYVVDTSPFDFGLLNGLLGIVLLEKNSLQKKIVKIL